MCFQFNLLSNQIKIKPLFTNILLKAHAYTHCSWDIIRLGLKLCCVIGIYYTLYRYIYLVVKHFGVVK